MRTFKKVSAADMMQQQITAMQSFNDSVKQTVKDLTDAGCIVTQHFPDEMVVTLPDGVTDPAAIDQFVQKFLMKPSCK